MKPRLRQPWYAASVDSTYLTGKRVFIFGDGTHVKAAARIARDEMGFEVVGIGCFNREMARDIRTTAKEYGVEALITDDYLEVEEAIEKLQPEMILGTQMERHIGKRLGIPCAVISAPVHVQDFPARYSPQMGFEGANVMFDTWVHPLVMGLEEHLLHMFRDDLNSTTMRDRPIMGLRQPRALNTSRRFKLSHQTTSSGLPMRKKNCGKSRSLCVARPAATLNRSRLKKA